LGKLCKQSDIITLHAPLNEHTRYLINKANLQLMKPGVMIVNTGRGGLVNTSDAIDALKEGKIGYLGLDVYEKEKGLFFYDHSHDIPQDDLFARLLTFKNVLLTGHQAFLTENALGNIADTTVYNLDCFQKGELSVHELTVAKKAAAL
jgi:D-lactate dehydrogenase